MLVSSVTPLELRNVFDCVLLCLETQAMVSGHWKYQFLLYLVSQILQLIVWSLVISLSPWKF